MNILLNYLIMKMELEKNSNFKLSDIVKLYETVPQKMENIKFDINKGNPLEIDIVIDEAAFGPSGSIGGIFGRA